MNPQLIANYQDSSNTVSVLFDQDCYYIQITDNNSNTTEYYQGDKDKKKFSLPLSV